MNANEENARLRAYWRGSSRKEPDMSDTDNEPTDNVKPFNAVKVTEMRDREQTQLNKVNDEISRLKGPRYRASAAPDHQRNPQTPRRGALA